MQKFITLLIFIIIEILAVPNESSFYKFSHDNYILNNRNMVCRDSDFYFKYADIEESNPENNEKIILYHGQSYGVWIFQLILKEFMFPEADEDWLPLRFQPEKTKIEKTDLMRLIKEEQDDHYSEYTKIGLAVSPNLFSAQSTESAWGVICMVKKTIWPKLTGLSDKNSFHKNFYRLIKQNFVSEDNWKKFIAQKKLINQFIQIKRRQLPFYTIRDYQEKIEKLFPETLKKFNDEFQILFNGMEDYMKTSNDAYYEGVALQIIMDRELADELTYNAHPFGYVKSNRYKKFEEFTYFNQGIWEGEELEPYSEIYDQVKNKNDNEQARLALNSDFVTFPSRVRIRSIAGIMKNPVDYQILKSMIREMIKGKKVKK